MKNKPNTKYAINEELLPYCHNIPHMPKWFTPVLQKMLRMMGKKLMRDERIDCETIQLDNGVNMFMLKPKGSRTKKVVLDIHGGGFVFPHAPYHIELAKEYALRLDAKVFLIDYRLAPKYQYPIAPEDCFAGLEYLMLHKEQLDIDMENLVIGGDSAGGYLAVSTTLKMYEKYGVAPKGNFLMYPAADTSKDTESMMKYTDTPLCNSEDAKIYDAWFNNGGVISVLNEDLSVIPKTYIEVAEFDCLRDGGLAYAKRLEELGIEVELHDVSGTMHGFDNGLDAKITRDCVENRIRFIEELL